MDNRKIVMSPAQCRAARGLLNLSQSQVAEPAHIATPTISEFERGSGTPIYNNLVAVRSVLESAGIIFIEENGGGPGARLRMMGDTDDLGAGMLTPTLCRAARRLVNLTQQHLADAANLGLSTVTDFERNTRVPLADNLASLRATLETAGAVFIPADKTAGPGVRLKK